LNDHASPILGKITPTPEKIASVETELAIHKLNYFLNTSIPQLKTMHNIYYNIDTLCEKLNCTHTEICKGLKPAISEFLENNSHSWVLDYTTPDNNGLVVLKRIA
jgi:hypothetical protein